MKSYDNVYRNENQKIIYQQAQAYSRVTVVSEPIFTDKQMTYFNVSIGYVEYACDDHQFGKVAEFVIQPKIKQTK
jgi:hypothetical protein